MNNLTIDDRIVSDYLLGNDVSVYKNDESFILGLDPLGNQINIFETPDYSLIDKAKLITHGFVETIKSIDFSKDPKINKFLGDTKQLEELIEIKLLVGLPHGVRRLFRSSNTSNKISIVIDVINGLNEDDDNDLYIEEFSNYIKYAILLMFLDANGPSTNDDPLLTISHAIYSASFAEYLSNINQLEKLEEIGLMRFWEHTEFKVLKKVLRHNNQKVVTDYMSLVVQSNPEMVVLGITGKRFLNDIDEEEAFNIYQDGAVQFVKKIVKNKANQNAILLPRLFNFLNKSLIILILGFIIWSLVGILFTEKLFNNIFYVYPLVIFIIWILKDLYAYKLEVKNMKQLLISGGILGIISIIYMIVVL